MTRAASARDPGRGTEDDRGTVATGAHLDSLEASLERRLATEAAVAVAFSGGVDSTLVLAMAVDVLGEAAVALTAVSPSLPRRELAACRRLAADLGARHILVSTDEVDDPRYAANTSARCYWCKDVVYRSLRSYARRHGLGTLMDGMNADDVAGHRPGRKAAEEQGVVSPLFEVGLGKDDVRAVARRRGLPNWDKPAMACLASRLPTGETVTAPKLHRVEAAEDVLASIGCRQYRVRHHGDVARIEVDPAEFSLVLAHRREIADAYAALGYRHVGLDIQGYRASGPAPRGTGP